jgi:hypothetical protein
MMLGWAKWEREKQDKNETEANERHSAEEVIL